MSQHAAPTPPAVRRRRRVGTVASIVGALALVGGIAIAAVFAFGSFSGATAFEDQSANARIVSVTNPANQGVDCTSAVKTGDSSFTVNPKARRLVVPNGTPTVTPGSCDVVLTVENNGQTTITPEARATLPGGWQLDTPTPSAVAPGGTTTILLRFIASEQAKAGSFTGTLQANTA